MTAKSDESLFRFSSGIYIIKNLVNSRFYVGSSVDLVRRHREHFKRLATGKHANAFLQADFNKCGGKQAFEFEILCFCDKDRLMQVEQVLLNRVYDSQKQCYNLKPTAANGLHTEEIKKKISLAHKGKRKSEEHRKNLSLAFTGRKLSEETKRKLSAINLEAGYFRGKHHTQALKEKLRANMLGKKVSPETRAKMSIVRTGKKKSPEHKEKIRLALLGKKHSEESKKKISRALAGKNKGKPRTPETREKLSRALTRFWKKKKGHIVAQ